MVWCLLAATGTDGARARFFKMARIETDALLADPCSTPELDVAEVWRDHRAKFLDLFTPVIVDAWLRSERREDAREWIIRVTEAEPLGEPPGEGWRPVRLEFMDDLHAIAVSFRIGPGVRVEAQGRIKVRLLETIDQIAVLYRHRSGVWLALSGRQLTSSHLMSCHASCIPRL